VLSPRLTRLVRTTALGVVALASVGAVLSCSDSGTPRNSGVRPSNSSMNTASQKTFENSASFVDVTDDPVSLPGERTIYPPSTGNGGLLAGATSAPKTLALLAIACTVVIAARMLTAPRIPSRIRS
jgi:hypothetical protein